MSIERLTDQPKLFLAKK